MTSSLRRLGFLTVLVGCFGYYAAAAAAGPYWLDSSEFAAQAFELGVAHPPGHPLAGVVGKALTLVPIGSIALRVSLAAALCAALGAAVLFLLSFDLARRAAAPRGAAPGPGLERTCALIALATTLAVALGSSYALQAVRPEVYALQSLLGVAVVAAVVHAGATGDRRWLLAAALAGALGLGNHHLLMLAVLAPAALVLLGRGGLLDRRTVLWATALVTLGLCVWLYLPLRAARRPEVNWGDARTPARFLWTVSAQAFAGKSLARAQSPTYAGALPGMAGVALEQLGPLALLGPLGLVLLARRPGGRRLAALLAGVAAAGAVATFIVGFDAENPDIHGYLGVPLGLGAAAAAAGLGGLAGAARRRRPPARGLIAAAAAALLALPAMQGARGFGVVDLRAAHGCALIAHGLLDSVPPRGALLTAYFQSAFALWFARGVEGARPDVDWAHLTFLGFPGVADDVVRRAPALAPLVAVRPVTPAALAAVAARRPVRLQPDISTGPGAAALLAVDGLTAEVLADDAARAAARARVPGAAAAVRADLARRLGADAREPQTARYLLYTAYVTARLHCLAGDRAAAAPALAQARALAPSDPELAALGRACGLSPSLDR
ncbi:MAG TPA: DUF2723 domain-containing protein [Polyangia bacterium]